MISINKEEAAAVRKKFPDACVVRTMTGHSSRHKYYCEESGHVMRLINKMRRNAIIKKKQVGTRG